MTLTVYLWIGLLGIIIGSFLNVLILRIPQGQDFVKEPSHCMKCGHRLVWKDLVPVFSYLFLKGRCRYCGSRISPQYPVIESVNGALWILCVAVRGFGAEGILLCLLSSLLLVISVIDWRTYEIPPQLNLGILILGIVKLFLVQGNRWEYIIGMFAVSVPLAILFYISKGKAIGGGDVKLMAAAGMFLGWKNAVLALALGCILGSVIHVMRMWLQGADRVLAMGPYLSAGIFLAALFGNAWITWYLSLLTV